MATGAATVAAETGGTYALVLTLDHEHRADVGALGPLRFPPGTYVHAGSAPGGLENHLVRLLEGSGGRRHVHQLAGLDGSRWAMAFPGIDDACELATHVARLPGALPVLGFGSTACTCLTHLHGFLGGAPQVAGHLAAFGRERGVEPRQVDGPVRA